MTDSSGTSHSSEAAGPEAATVELKATGSDATAELKPAAAAAAVAPAPAKAPKRFGLRSAPRPAEPRATVTEEAPPPSKPGAFPITHAPHLAHIGESRVAVIGIEPILDGPERLRAEAWRLIGAGFNALALPLFDDGFTVFPSTAMTERGLPRQHPDLRRRDVLAEAGALALELRAPLLLTVDFLKAGDRGLGVRYPALRRNRRWGMRNAAGHLLPLGPETQCPMFCPSSRGALDYYAAVCLEAATAYPISGFILEVPPLAGASADAPLADYCYCHECRERFIAPLADGASPAELAGDADFRGRKAWAFRQAAQHAVLHVRNRVKETRSDCLFFLQAAMSRSAAAAVDLHPGSAWHPLAANGALDGVFVSNYSFRGADFGRELAHDLAALSSEANLGAALRSIRPDTLEAQIAILREQGVFSFMLMHAAGLTPAALEDLTRRSLPWPGFHVESAPRRAVTASLRRLQFINAGCPPLNAFFRDIGRYLSTRIEELSISDVEAMIDNLENIRGKIRQGSLPLSAPAEKVQRLVSQLQKSLFMLCKTMRG